MKNINKKRWGKKFIFLSFLFIILVGWISSPTKIFSDTLAKGEYYYKFDGHYVAIYQTQTGPHGADEITNLYKIEDLPNLYAGALTTGQHSLASTGLPQEVGDDAYLGYLKPGILNDSPADREVGYGKVDEIINNVVNTTGGSGLYPDPNISPAAAINNAKEYDDGVCWRGITRGFNAGNCLAQGGYYILFVLSRGLAILGLLFNFIIQATILKMATNIRGLSAINVGWIAFRDIANIIFIFALLYISIATILRLSGYAAKDLLVKLIIAALLINFSLFFTKIIIDSANILTINVYQNIKITDTNGESRNLGIDSGINSGNNLGDAFMSVFRLQTLSSFNGSAVGINGTTNASQDNAQIFARSPNAFVLTVAGSIFLLLAIFVFLSAGILFLVRFALLIILMVLSPLAFAGSILPKTKTYSDQWWSTLASESFFAPLFMLLVWFVLRVVNDPMFKNAVGLGDGSRGNSNTTFVGAISDPTNGSAMGIILNFGIIITFLIATLVISKQLGAKGGAAALSTFNSLRNTTQGFIFRNALGRPARRLEEVMDQSRSRFLNRAFPATIRDITTRALVGAKFGGKLTAEEAYREGQERASKREATKEANLVRDAAKNLINVEAKFGKNSEEYKKALTKGETAMGKLNAREVMQSFSRAELTKNPVLLSFANYSQVKGIYEDEHKLNEQEKDHMLEEYYKELTSGFKGFEKEIKDRKEKGMSEFNAVNEAMVTPVGKTLRKRIRAMSVKDFELLHEIRPDLLTNDHFVPIVRSGTMETLRTDDNLPNTMRDRMRLAKYAPYKEGLEAIKKLVDVTGPVNTPQVEERYRELLETLRERYTTKEAASAPGEIRKDKALYQLYDRAIANHWREKDQYERVDLMKWWAQAIAKGQVTKAMQDSMDWMKSTKEGKDFYASGKKQGVIFDFDAIKNMTPVDFITDRDLIGGR